MIDNTNTLPETIDDLTEYKRPDLRYDLIVKEIAEVQPMRRVPLKTGEDYNKARAEFWVSPSYDPTMPWDDMRERNRQINEWCEETYGPIGDWHDTACRWHASNRKYIFHNEADRTMFVLRWS